MHIDLNCDMGESFGAYTIGADAEMMPLITSANIAAGFHAGDPQVIDRTIALAVQHGVAIGAHPGFPDLVGFGRRNMSCTPDEVEAMVLYQVAVVAGFAQAHGATLTHVKAHGALYNMAAQDAAQDAALALAIARGVARFDKSLALVGLSGSQAMRQAAESTGLRLVPEAFPDRRYNADGTLVSRRAPGAVIHAPEQVAAQAVMMAHEQCVIALDGTRVPIAAETLCLHGDNPAAVENARALRQALQSAGIEVKRL